MKRIKIGTRVIGPDGIGTVKAHVSKHDIHVQCDNGASALYCQDKDCKMYEAVYPLPSKMTKDFKIKLGAIVGSAKAKQTYTPKDRSILDDTLQKLSRLIKG